MYYILVGKTVFETWTREDEVVSIPHKVYEGPFRTYSDVEAYIKDGPDEVFEVIELG